MPIRSRLDAQEVDERIQRIFDATSTDERLRALRSLFVEVLDFRALQGGTTMAPQSGKVFLPDNAHRIADADGYYVLYVDLQETDTPHDQIRRADVLAAANSIRLELNDDFILVFTDKPQNGEPRANQVHFILPDFTGSRPILRRLSAERGQHWRTTVEQLSSLYWEWRDKGEIFPALNKAFDAEPVTRKFFQEYKRVFDQALDLVTGFGVNQEEQESKRIFVQTLFNRLMFVYFLSRKNWLNFEGDTDYLNALWDDYRQSHGTESFYRGRLTTLFFAGLNNPQSRDLTWAVRPLIGNVPFLNGGLFEDSELDKRAGIHVPDEAIEPILVDLFDRFNFTVMESTPYDTEVAVDPEMLGKVFEELVTGRHESGSYYTPRPVVSFMCREALKGYLDGQDTGVSEEAIAALVDHGDTSGISPLNAQKLAQALADVTVVDPACGSGAYLLGMMQELVELYFTLYNVGVDPQGLFDLKLHIIQRNLYGVDNDDFAVNIAMLRLWLSLAIEYEADTPQPLPNLDFKIVAGDSLLGLDPNPSQQSDLFGDAIRNSDLGQLKGSYLRAQTPEQKRVLRSQIERAEEGLSQLLGDVAQEGVVEWRVQFAEVMAKGGFDIAIANPPYVRQEEIGPTKPLLTKMYSASTTARSDLYCYFYTRALQLLTDGGTHVFVCSNSWLDVGYGAKLQHYLLQNAHVQSIYESAIERQFSTALINTIISVVRKTSDVGSNYVRFTLLQEPFEQAIAPHGQRREVSRVQRHLLAAGTNPQNGKFVGDKWGGRYLRAPNIYHHILSKCEDKLVRLGDIATVRFGLKSGANEFFFIKSETIEEFGIEDEFLRPIMTTPQESRRISVDPSKLPKRVFMCHEPNDELTGTAALEYIKWGESEGFHQRRSCAARALWYDLGDRQPARLAMNYLINTTARTYVAEDLMHFGDNFQEVRSRTVSWDHLSVIMNSTVFQLFVNLAGRTNFGGGLLKIQTFEVESLLVLNPEFITAPDADIFESANWDVLSPSPERVQVDKAVFDALELDDVERMEVYEAVWELVKNRQRRAASVA